MVIASLIGVGAVKGWFPGGSSPKQGDARPADPGRKLIQPSSCALCGTVESIWTVEVRDEAVGAGAASPAGAGEQAVGGSRGAAVTLLGAGGAIAGNEIEKNVKKRYAYRVTVRMDDGSWKTITQENITDLRTGDRVRVEGDYIYRV